MIAYRNKKDKIATLKCRICSEEYQGRIHCTLFFIVFFIVFPRLTLTRTNEQILVSPLMCTMSGLMSWMRKEIQVVRIVIAIRFYVDGSICIFIHSDFKLKLSSRCCIHYLHFILSTKNDGLFTTLECDSWMWLKELSSLSLCLDRQNFYRSEGNEQLYVINEDYARTRQIVAFSSITFPTLYFWSSSKASSCDVLNEL